MRRRSFIRGLGLGAIGLMLGGCDFEDPFTTKEEQKQEADAFEFSGTVEYRQIPHSGEKISTLAIGASALHESSAKNIERMIAYAAEHGINLMDTVMSNFGPSEAMAAGIKGRRDKMLTQMHIGVYYPNETYTRTRDMKQVQSGFEQQLKGFGTDYSDIGMIHYVDTAEDFQKVIDNGLLDYAQKLKKDGTIRYIGFSSHSVDISKKFLETGLIDVFMFSLNPAYDFVPENGVLKLAADRKNLYEEAQKRGAVITVMKVYGGGRLLSDSSSPFGKAMTTAQCIQYALDRPAVISCIPGVRNMSDINAALAFYNTSREERDYSAVFAASKQDMEGVCIYCDHCQPCPYGIDIASVSKYYDLAKSGDALAKDHYFKLNRTARDCARCGECEPRCPFHVNIEDRMQEIENYFGQ
ncbi:aldo/keto reductase [Pectinatus haikarae]|uniref:aldo/keto reductase n=1 Tax=Pectinatus haikarae TaxID=349096 RepID=UPI0018C8570D